MNAALPKSIDEMKDILDLHEIITLKWPHTIVQIALILLATLVLALLIYGLIKIYKRFFSKKPLSPDQIALQALMSLQKNRLVEQGNAHDFYFILDDILRRYLEQQFCFFVLDKTYEQLLLDWKALSSLFVEQEKDRLDLFLKRAQIVKFAHAAVRVEDASGDFEFVMRFVQRTAIKNPAGVKYE